MEFKIGSFNLKQFAYHSTKDIAKIAEIIQGEGMDIVALQEIFGDKFSKDCGAKALIDYLCGWDYCFDIPKDTRDFSKIRNVERREGYSYIWNTKRFKLSEYRELGLKKNFEL